MMPAVRFQIAHDIITRGIFVKPVRHSQTRQPGMFFVRVKMKPVIMAAPGRTHIVRLFQDQGLPSPLLQRRGTGKTRGAGANYDRFTLGHGSAPSTDSPLYHEWAISPKDTLMD